MTTYRPFREYDIVELIDRTEIEPAFYLDKGTIGVVKDRCIPDYYLVVFQGWGAYWVSGEKLQRKLKNM